MWGRYLEKRIGRADLDTVKRDALNRWSARLDQLFEKPARDRQGDPAEAPDAPC